MQRQRIKKIFIFFVSKEELVEQQYNVVVLDNLEAGHKEAVNPKAKLEIVDLKDGGEISEVFDKYKFKF